MRWIIISNHLEAQKYFETKLAILNDVIVPIGRYGSIDNQENFKVSICNPSVNIAPVENLAPLEARTSAGAVENCFGLYISGTGT